MLDLDLEADLLSLSHAVDGFLLAPTLKRSRFSNRELNVSFAGSETLRNHLAATVLVRIGGAVAGFATEQERVTPPGEGHAPPAESSWLITLDGPGSKGVLFVAQREGATQVFELAERVVRQPNRAWEDRPLRFLSTVGPTRVALATADLAVYEGGLFKGYNFLNPADFRRLHRFRGTIQFVVYPRDAPHADPPL